MFFWSTSRIDRHEQAALGVDGDADVDVLLVDDLAGATSIDELNCGKTLQRAATIFTATAVTVSLPPAFSTSPR